MRTKDIIAGALVLGACLAIGDKPWGIGLAVLCVLAALGVTQ